MNRVDLAFGFAQARLQARYGDRPANAEWNHLEATGDLALALQVVRGTALARWTGRLGAKPGVHEIELRLREEWQRRVVEVASWQPAPWRAAVDWLRWLPYLPALQKLARRGHAPAWMRADPVLGPIVASEPRDRAAALRGSALAPLAAAFQPDSDMSVAWAEHWRTLWPGNEATRVPLLALLRATAGHGQRLAALSDETRSREANTSFGRRLQFHFRRHAFSPTSAVAYLGLLALDLQRLRGLLAVRALREEAAAPS